MNIVSYIEKMGVRKTAKTLDVSPQTVLQWKNLETTPRPMTAHKIIELTGGILSWEDIYKPYVMNQLTYVDPSQGDMFQEGKK